MLKKEAERQKGGRWGRVSAVSCPWRRTSSSVTSSRPPPSPPTVHTKLLSGAGAEVTSGPPGEDRRPLFPLRVLDPFPFISLTSGRLQTLDCLCYLRSVGGRQETTYGTHAGRFRGRFGWFLTRITRVNRSTQLTVERQHCATPAA